MQAVSLKVRNIGAIEDATIPFNKPLTILYGEIRRGKTTLLNCVKWVCGGAYPADLLRHGTDEGEIEFAFSGGTIRREFYRNAKGEVEARPLSFIKDGQAVKKPVDAIKAILNPFMLDQDYFARRNAKDRQLFLLEALGADTTAEDAAIAKCEEAASKIRQELATMGVPVEVPAAAKPADVAELQKARAARVTEWQTALSARTKAQEQAQAVAQRKNEAVREGTVILNKLNQAKTDLSVSSEAAEAKAIDEVANDAKVQTARLNAEQMDRTDKLRLAYEQKLADLKRQYELDLAASAEADMKARYEVNRKRDVRIAELRKTFTDSRATYSKEVTDYQRMLDENVAYVAGLVPPAVPPEPVLDTAQLDQEISAAAAAAVAYDRYQAFLAARQRRQEAAKRLAEAETATREAREAKRKSLAKLAETSPIPKLTFSKDGDPIYDNTSMEMLSTSQLTELQSALAGLYPEGLGVELLDRGESMGKSIFGLIDRAQKQGRTIMAAVVGDKPAVTPENVGVFVVEDGKVKS